MLVTFPDVPEAVTFGADEADALHHAADALETAFMAYIEDGRPIPEPSPIRRKKWAVMTAPTAAPARSRHPSAANSPPPASTG